MSKEKPQLPKRVPKKTIDVEVENLEEESWIPQIGDYVEYIGSPIEANGDSEVDPDEDPDEFYEREGHYPTPEEECHTIGKLYLIYKLETVGGHIHNVTVDGDGYSEIQMLYPEFLNCFKYRPDGPDIRAQEIQEILGEVNKSQKEVAEINLNTQIEDRQSPLLTMKTSDPGTALVAPDSTQKLLDTTLQKSKRMQEKFEVAHKKVEGIAKHIEQRMSLIKSKVEEQSTRLQLIASRTSKQVKRLSEMVWTLKLYLGTEEQVIQITEGEPCLAEIKCAVRQKLLFMDEEVAVLCEKGGLDFETLEEFDEWITLPENLKRVLPEEKGIVAFRVRRRKKEYGGKGIIAALQNAQKDEENMKTYFLIRNGENTYRIWSDINVGARLFPLKDEFDNFFKKTDRNYDWEEEEYKEETEIIDPENLKYAKSVASAESRKEHYMRILFILQGLLDRTPILDPKPKFKAEEGGLFKRDIAERYFEFIKDDEMLLPTGRKPFWEWLAEVNSRVVRGSRIILAEHFDSYGTWQYKKGDFNSRIGSIRGEGGYCSISNPNCGPHVLEDQISATEFKFLYYPKEWASYGERYREIEGRRVSVRVKTDDKWWLHFDEISPEDIDFYIWSRVDRPDYLEMIPLLRSIKALKIKEEEEEKPFKEWVVTAISAHYGVQKQEDLDREVESVISWWKLKYRNNRPIKADDAKAQKDIMREIKKRAAVRKSTIPSEKIVATIQQSAKETKQDLIVIFQVDAKHFISFYRYNEEFEFLYEKRWVISRGKLKVELQKDAQIINRRHRKWTEIWAHDEWEKWDKDNPRDRFLDKQERMEIVEQAKQVRFGDRNRDNNGWERRVIGVRQVDGREIAIAVYFEAPEPTTEDHWKTEFQKDVQRRTRWFHHSQNVRNVPGDSRIEEYQAIWKPKNKCIDFGEGPFILYDNSYGRKELYDQKEWENSRSHFGRKKKRTGDVNKDYYNVHEYFWYDVIFLDKHIKPLARKHSIVQKKDEHAYDVAIGYFKKRCIFRQDDTPKFMLLRYWVYWQKWTTGSIPEDHPTLKFVDETYLKYFDKINAHDDMFHNDDVDSEELNEKIETYINELYVFFKDKKTFSSLEGKEDDPEEIKLLEKEEEDDDD